MKINHNFESIDGNDLTTFFTSEEKNDRSIYLESGDIQEQKEGKVIGIRTNNYKYLRSRNNPKQNISLYDLKNDPMETNNLSSNTELVKKLEKILLSLLDKHEPSEILSTLTESEEIKINEELKKMGYIKWSYLAVQSLSKNKRIGLNFLSILNDIKRRPEDAAEELGVPTEEINQIIAGEKELSFEIVNRAIEIWPLNARDFFLINDDENFGQAFNQNMKLF